MQVSINIIFITDLMPSSYLSKCRYPPLSLSPISYPHPSRLNAGIHQYHLYYLSHALILLGVQIHTSTNTTFIIHQIHSQIITCLHPSSLSANIHQYHWHHMPSSLQSKCQHLLAFHNSLQMSSFIDRVPIN